MTDTECYNCGAGIDKMSDNHFILKEQPRPVPDRFNMDFVDWFQSNWILCVDCAPDVGSRIQPDGERDD